MSKTNCFKIIFRSVIVASLLFSTALIAQQPSIIDVEGGQLKPGQQAQLILKGKLFSKITELASVTIGDFDARIIDNGIPAESNRRMFIKVEIPDELKPGEYPIEFIVSGDGFANWKMLSSIGGKKNQPEITIFRGTRSLKSSPTTLINFDSTMAGTPVKRTFKVGNTGLADLSLLDVKLPDGFSLEDTLINTIHPGYQVFMNIMLEAKTPGIYQGIFELENNDPNENPFLIKFLGKVLEPPTPIIQLFVNDSLIVNDREMTLDFGAIESDSISNKIIKLINAGNAILSIKDPQSPDGFKIAADFPIEVEPGDSASLAIQLSSSDPALYSGVISFQTNIINKKMIFFRVKGSVINAAPREEIAVTADQFASSDSITDGLITEVSEKTSVSNADSSNNKDELIDPEPWWQPNIYYLLIAVILVLVLIWIFTKLSSVIVANGAKIYPLSAIHFETTIDTGSQTINESKIIDNKFQFLLKPVFNLGKTELVAGKSSLIDTAKINLKNPEQREDNLTRIEGIGPVISTLLMEAEIRTYEKLSKTKVKVLKDILDRAKINIADPTTWPKQAKLASSSEWQKLEQLQEKLKGGRIVDNINSE